MSLHPPSWWQDDTGHILPKYLNPLGQIYGQAVKWRFRYTKPYQSKLPVICIGNFTLGGTGKTPLAIKFAHLLQDLGWDPSFLSRGYKGKYAGPLLVNLNEHNAKDVGDEPLLLSQHAPAIISKNRIEGVWLIEQRSSNMIIMDDGFQNPTVQKNLSFIAIDSATALGNGRIFPAGPLRAPLEFQLPNASAIIITGSNTAEKSSIKDLLRKEYNFKKPILRGQLTASEDTSWLKEKPILAYAGIGRPEKLFQSLENAGGKVIRRNPFPDHHNFTSKDAEHLTKIALADDLQLVTTEKDHVRIDEHSNHQLRALKRMSRPFPIEFTFEKNDEEKLIALIKEHYPKPIAPETLKEKTKTNHD